MVSRAHNALESNADPILRYAASSAGMGSKGGDSDDEPLLASAKHRTAPAAAAAAAAPAASTEQPGRLTRQGSRQSREPTAEPDDARLEQGVGRRATRTASGRKQKGEAHATKTLPRSSSQMGKVDRTKPPPTTTDTIPYAGPHEIAVG